MEENLNRLRINAEMQLLKVTNEVQTQTIKGDVVEGREYFSNVVYFNDPTLAKISNRLFDDKI
jgi:hypothetical protein